MLCNNTKLIPTSYILIIEFASFSFLEDVSLSKYLLYLVLFQPRKRTHITKNVDWNKNPL